MQGRGAAAASCCLPEPNRACSRSPWNPGPQATGDKGQPHGDGAGPLIPRPPAAARGTLTWANRGSKAHAQAGSHPPLPEVSGGPQGQAAGCLLDPGMVAFCGGSESKARSLRPAAEGQVGSSKLGCPGQPLGAGPGSQAQRQMVKWGAGGLGSSCDFGTWDPEGKKRGALWSPEAHASVHPLFGSGLESLAPWVPS